MFSFVQNVMIVVCFLESLTNFARSFRDGSYIAKDKTYNGFGGMAILSYVLFGIMASLPVTNNHIQFSAIIPMLSGVTYIAFAVAYLNLTIFFLNGESPLFVPLDSGYSPIIPESIVLRSLLIIVVCIISGFIFWITCYIFFVGMRVLIESDDFRRTHSVWVGFGPRFDIDALGVLVPALIGPLAIVYGCFVMAYKLNKHISGRYSFASEQRSA
jgi:hypothetical protein